MLRIKRRFVVFSIRATATVTRIYTCRQGGVVFHYSRTYVNQVAAGFDRHPLMNVYTLLNSLCESDEITEEVGTYDKI